jgi:hypothetical protein
MMPGNQPQVLESPSKESSQAKSRHLRCLKNLRGCTNEQKLANRYAGTSTWAKVVTILSKLGVAGLECMIA